MSAVQKSSLDALARELLAAASASSSGRAARTVYGGHEHVLRQTVIALAAGQAVAEHENPARPPFTSCTGGSAWSAVRTPGRAGKATC